MKKRPVLRKLRQDLHRHDRPDYYLKYTHLYLSGLVEKRCTADERCLACRVRFGLP